jgi:hypothetical protein
MLKRVARSNSANELICIIMRPAGVVVSMFSVIDRRPAPALEEPSFPRRRRLCPGAVDDGQHPGMRPESQVRTRLAAGAKRIRTAGPTSDPHLRLPSFRNPSKI